MLAEIQIDLYGNIHFYNEHGRHHRVDGPAVVYDDGSNIWYVNGKRHRIYGPAIEDINGKKYWFINGKKYSEKEFNDYVGELC